MKRIKNTPLKRANTSKHKRLDFITKNGLSTAKEVNMAVMGFHSPGHSSSTMSSMVSNGLLTSSHKGYEITLFGLSELGRLEQEKIKSFNEFQQKVVTIELEEKLKKVSTIQLKIIDSIFFSTPIKDLENQFGLVVINKEINLLLLLGILSFDGEIVNMGSNYELFKSVFISNKENKEVMSDNSNDKEYQELLNLEEYVGNLRKDINYFKYQINNSDCFRQSKTTIETYKRTLKVLENELKNIPSHLQSVPKIRKAQKELLAA